MDIILQTLLSWQFIIFGLGIAAVMFVLRTIVEYLMSVCQIIAKEAKLWNDLLLPILPVFIGSIGAFYFESYPYPEKLTTDGDRILFGLVAGLLSTLLYRIVKAMFIQKLQSLNPEGQKDE